MLESVEPACAFRADMPPEEMKAWQERVRQAMQQLMHFPQAGERPAPKLVRTAQREGYRIERWESYPFDKAATPYLLLIPDGVSESAPAPAVFCIPGSGQTKEQLAGESSSTLAAPPAQNPGNNAMALHYVRRGFVCLASDNAGTGEQEGAYDRQQFSLKLIFKGRNYVGLGVLYRWAMLKWLMALDYVDGGRIALAGHSLGTETTMFLALLEPAVKAVSHNDFMSDNEQRIISCFPPLDFMFNQHCHLVPGMHEWFSFPDLIAAFAPNPMLLSEGGVQADLERIGKAYEVAGAPENYRYVHYPEYQDPANRKYDYIPIPEGITNEEYFKYANVVPARHFYKSELCVPWMAEALGWTGRD